MMRELREEGTKRNEEELRNTHLLLYCIGCFNVMFHGISSGFKNTLVFSGSSHVLRSDRTLRTGLLAFWPYYGTRFATNVTKGTKGAIGRYERSSEVKIWTGGSSPPGRPVRRGTPRPERRVCDLRRPAPSNARKASSFCKDLDLSCAGCFI